jgi:hypothetical protein
VDGDVVKCSWDYASYVLHLGVDEYGNDYFPQELADTAYYTGPAAAGQTNNWMFGDPYNLYTVDQAALYQTYHLDASGTDGQDMNTANVRSMIQGIKPVTTPSYAYNFVAEADDNESMAIKRFIHWCDFDVQAYYPSGTGINEPNVPSLIVTADTTCGYQWKTLRGFATSVDPCDDGSVFTIPDMTVYGLWLNDPAIGGLGYNVYLTGDAFKADEYEQVDGKYRSVCEPPEDLDVELFNQNLAAARISFTQGKQVADLSMAMTTMGSAEERDAEFEKVNWEDVIPSYLRVSPEFDTVFSKCRFSGTLEVDDLKTGDTYQLVTFSQGTEVEFQPIEKKVCRLSRMRIDKSDPTASIVLLVNKADGKFRQATWAAEDQKYMPLTEDEAVSIARNAVGGKQLKRIDGQAVAIGKIDERGEVNVSLVYNEDCSSRFLPMYEVIMEDGTVIRVMQDGTYIIMHDGSMGYLTADIEDLICCGVATDIDPVMAGQIERYACEDYIESCAPIGPNCMPLETAEEVINASPTDSWHIVPGPVGVVVPCP